MLNREFLPTRRIAGGVEHGVALIVKNRGLLASEVVFKKEARPPVLQLLMDEFRILFCQFFEFCHLMIIFVVRKGNEVLRNQKIALNIY